MLWRAFLALPIVTLLTACDPEHSEVVVKFVCLRINEYDDSVQDKAIAELEALPKDSALRRLIGDYKHLRQKVRECRKKAEEVSK